MNLYLCSFSFNSLFSVLLGLFVIFKNPKSKVNRTWALACLSCAGWSFFSVLTYSATDLDNAILFSKILNVFAAYLCVFVAHFCKEISESKTGNTVIKIGYFNCLLITLFAFTNHFTSASPFLRFNYFPVVKPFYHFFTAHFLFYSVYADCLLIKSLSYLPEVKRNQIKYILIGITTGYIAGITTFFTAYRIPLEPFLANFVWLYAAIITYAIIKHQLMDIKVVIKKTLFYSFFAFLVSALYVVMIFIAHAFFIKEKISAIYLTNSVVLLLLIALFLRPIEIFLRQVLDKKFFRGTIEEISEQKEKLETELERQQRLKSVGILAAGMAHEIKNPITAIKTFAEYLPQKHDDPEFREKFSRIIAQETARIQEIVTNLLIFSKPAEPNKRECDVTKIIQDIAELLSSELLKNNIKFSFNFSSDTPSAYVDSDQMKQALLNILMNAIDAMKGRGGNLTVTTTREGKGPRIEIKDTGCGITEDKLNHILTRFTPTRNMVPVSDLPSRTPSSRKMAGRSKSRAIRTLALHLLFFYLEPINSTTYSCQKVCVIQYIELNRIACFC